MLPALVSGPQQHELDKLQFVVSFQPIVDARSGGLAGFEALLRWQHPTRGLVLPDASILSATGLRPDRLELELTESATIVITRTDGGVIGV